MHEYFSQKTNFDIFCLRKQFHASTKNTNESISNWYQRLEKLVDPCEYGNHTEIFFMDKFISGLEENVFRELSKRYYINLHSVLGIALEYEKSLIKNENIENDGEIREPIDLLTSILISKVKSL